MTAPGYGRRVRAVAVPYTVLRIGGQALEFVGFVLLARHLAPEAFGQLSIAFLVCRYAGSIADWGAVTRGPRDVAAEGRHGSVRSYVRWRGSVAVVMGVVVGAGFLLTGHADLAPTLIVIFNLGLSRDWVALGREQGTRAAVPAAVQGALLCAGAILAMSAGGGAVVIAVAYGAAAVTSIALNPVGHEPGGVTNRGPDAWILLALLSIQITSSFDTILLGALQGSSEAGIYAAVYRIPNAWLALMTAVIGSALPIVTRAVSTHGEDAVALQRRSMRASRALAGCVLLGAPIGYVLVPVLLGTAYAPGQVPLVLIIVATAVITLTAPLHVFAVARGSDRTYALIVAAGAVTNIVLNLAFIPLWSMTGAALATLAAQTLVAGALWRFVRNAPVVEGPADDDVADVADELPADP